MDRHEGRRRRATLRQGLENQRGIKARQRRAANILTHIDAGKTERGGLSHRFDGEHRIAIPSGGMRRKFVGSKTPRDILECLLLFGQLEVHLCPPAPVSIRRDTGPCER